MGKPTIGYANVDISDFDVRKADIGQQLAQAAKTIGFFFVSGPFPAGWRVGA